MLYNDNMKELKQKGVLLTDHDLDEKSVVVVGDIHGCATALKELIEHISDTNCQVVFVGDLLDRGSEGAEVISTVHTMCTNPEKFGLSSAMCLMGNHERMILDAHSTVVGDTDHRLISLWLQNGGIYDDFQFITNEKLWAWLHGLPLWYEHPNPVKWNDRELKLLVTHGSVAPQTPLREQDPMTLYWGRDVVGYSPEHLTVNGHTVCRGGEPLEFETPTGTVLRIDTGSYFTGVVTGLALREAL